MSNRQGIGGRPKKFSGPSRPITVTLPEQTIRDLEAVDADRARAIVRVTDAMVSSDSASSKLVEIVRVSPNIGMIIIGPSKALRAIPFVQLAEVASGRHLISLTPGTAPETLEVAVTDLLDSMPDLDDRERRLLVELASCLKQVRRGKAGFGGIMLFVHC